MISELTFLSYLAFTPNINFVSVGLPTLYLFPGYLYPNQYTPSYLFHPVQPPAPHQFHTTVCIPFIHPAPMLIIDVTKDYLHHLDDKVIQLDVKIAQIRMLIEKKNTVANFPNFVQEDEFEISDEACEENTHFQNFVKVEVDEQGSDKFNQIIEILEKMGKRLADMSKTVKENTNEESTQSKVMSLDLVKQSSNTRTLVSTVDDLNNSSRVDKTLNDNNEETNYNFHNLQSMPLNYLLIVLREHA